MLFPPVPENESIRLQALHELNILDTDPDVRIEIITKSITTALNVPICLVSLIDDNRQWFKSAVGLDAKETPRYMSFCAHAICETINFTPESRIFEVHDTTADIRFVDNPLVIGHPRIKSYIGYVLQPKTHINLGTLCFIDTRPRIFTDEEKGLLVSFGNLIQKFINGYPNIAKS